MYIEHQFLQGITPIDLRPPRIVVFLSGFPIEVRRISAFTSLSWLFSGPWWDVRSAGPPAEDRRPEIVRCHWSLSCSLTLSATYAIILQFKLKQLNTFTFITDNHLRISQEVLAILVNMLIKINLAICKKFEILALIFGWGRIKKEIVLQSLFSR